MARAWCGAFALAVLLGLPAPAPAASPTGEDARYALAGGCYALRSDALDRLVAKAGDGGYRASAGGVGDAEPFRMQATDLGRYLFFGRAGDFMAGGGEGGLAAATRAGEAADWRVDVARGAFRITLPSAGKVLTAHEDGALALAGAGADGDATRFTFERAEGCAEFPEAEVNASGAPPRGPTPYGQVSGLLDAHLHMMAFEFIGGRVRCGRPWHPYGIAHALVDCPDHEPGGAGAILENVLKEGNPVGTHDTTGWPTFRDWPAHRSLTHEQVYYKWLERAWRGGLRLFVNLLVDNAVLCEVYPYKRNSCNEMDNVRLQAARIHELQDYIDAQSGGPGKGWFRIVRDPFEARRVINDGRLAVVLGIENSKLFDCGVYNDVPECTKADIDRQMDEMYDLGVRSMELVNKYDNALAGVAGDPTTTGVLVNSANRYETGRFWEMRTCDSSHEHGAHDHGGVHDREQIGTPLANQDNLAGAVYGTFAPPGVPPIYPQGPHCNARGLTALGEYTIRRMIDKGMIFDPDHMSVLARDQALAVIEAERYSGVISSHSWSTPDALPRIYRLGGVVTPYAGNSETFVKAWRRTKEEADDRFFFGFGYGADTNGFGGQAAPRGADVENPVTYPFTSWDGKVTLDKQVSGRRVYDINVDGVAHYGLYPDWIEDLRKLAGDEIVEDMGRGAEAYLQMWERARGIPRHGCRATRMAVRRGGVGAIRLGADPQRLLRTAGQPLDRGGRTWRWCAKARGEDAEDVAVFTSRDRVGLVASTAPGHRALGIGPGARASRLEGRGERFGPGVRVRPAGNGRQYVYVIRKGRVRSVAVASRGVAANPERLHRYLRRAGLR